MSKLNVVIIHCVRIIIDDASICQQHFNAVVVGGGADFNQCIELFRQCNFRFYVFVKYFDLQISK